MEKLPSLTTDIVGLPVQISWDVFDYNSHCSFLLGKL